MYQTLLEAMESGKKETDNKIKQLELQSSQKIAELERLVAPVARCKARLGETVSKSRTNINNIEQGQRT